MPEPTSNVFDLTSTRGKNALSICAAVIDGKPYVQGALIDMPWFPPITCTAAEARRLAEFITARAEAAERAAYVLEEPQAPTGTGAGFP